MFNITDGKNNISRDKPDKPVENIDLVIGLHVSACTSCTRTMRFRRDIAIDITESVQLLVCIAALRSMPNMPKLEHDNVDAMQTSSCTDSVMSIALSRRKRLVRVQEVQADTWRPMTNSMFATGLSREMLLLPSVMLSMVIARAGACWRPLFDDLVQDVAPA